MRRHAAWAAAVLSALGFALASSFATPQPVTKPVVAPLPKACWSPTRLVGRDTQYLYLPCNDLRMLDSATRAQVECTLTRMKEHGGFPAVVYESYRSDWRQYRLWLQGRPNEPGGRPGVRVTNAKSAAKSAHGTGFGVDIIHARDGWNNARFFRSLKDHAFTCGLESGGSWVKFPDPPHAQSRRWTAARTTMIAAGAK